MARPGAGRERLWGVAPHRDPSAGEAGSSGWKVPPESHQSRELGQWSVAVWICKFLCSSRLPQLINPSPSFLFGFWSVDLSEFLKRFIFFCMQVYMLQENEPGVDSDKPSTSLATARVCVLNVCFVSPSCRPYSPSLMNMRCTQVKSWCSPRRTTRRPPWRRSERCSENTRPSRATWQLTRTEWSRLPPLHKSSSMHFH